MNELIERGFKAYRPRECRYGPVSVVIPPTASGKPYLVFLNRRTIVCSTIDKVMEIVDANMPSRKGVKVV